MATKQHEKSNINQFIGNATDRNIRLPRFASLLSDAGFKAILADRRNEEILRRLINLILPEDRQVVKIEEYEDREMDGFTPFSKSARVDVRCRDIHGRSFIVEMQRKMHESFIQRCIWYGAKAYGKDLTPGAEYSDLKPVYVIAFLEENLPHEDESLWDTDNFISCYQMIEKRTGEFAPDAIFCIFAELGRFRKDASLLESTLEKTCYVFKNSEKWESGVPQVILDDEFTSELSRACEVGNFPPDVKLKFVRDMFTEMDYKAETKAYFKDGFAAGEAEGIMKGKAEGREEGMREGMREKALDTARKLLAAGIPAETVASCTGLSLDGMEGLYSLDSEKNGKSVR